MSEAFNDQISRLRMMVSDHGQTWDLSPNDEAAIHAVLAERDRMQAEIERLQDLCEYAVRVITARS